MTWKDEFISLSQPADGRVAPAFKPHHAAVALIMIGREQPLGRYELCGKMSIGEGSARTYSSVSLRPNILSLRANRARSLLQKDTGYSMRFLRTFRLDSPWKSDVS